MLLLAHMACSSDRAAYYLLALLFFEVFFNLQLQAVVPSIHRQQPRSHCLNHNRERTSARLLYI